MPDWTYQTVFRPLLLSLGVRRGRDVALGFMGTLSRLPLGRRVIQLMGHMKPDPRLEVQKGGLHLRSPVGLGFAMDSTMRATPAFAEFGFGYLEIGPIVANPAPNLGNIQLDAGNEVLWFEPPCAALTPLAASQRLQRDGPLGLPIFARVEAATAEEANETVNLVGPHVDGFVVAVRQTGTLCAAISGHASARGRWTILAAVHAHAWRSDEDRELAAQAIHDGAIHGLVMEPPPAPEGGAYQVGRQGFVQAVESVAQIRMDLGPEPLVVGSVGVHDPADALDYIEAGADLVQVDSGLLFAGPGLPKRINEAFLYHRLMTDAPASPPLSKLGGESWFWALLMGMSMVIGGVMAMAVATTRVVLPYDESLVGLTREQLAEINSRLLSFMTHDRVTLAGTMLAVGSLYVALAWWGIRRGVHWAYVAVIASAFAGFFTFFSFLGFGYFDPFHAFVTAILFQFLLLTIHARLPPQHQMPPPDLWNDGRWKANQWGQLAFVVHGAVLIVAGLVISYVGMTRVFVPEDLEFMRTTAEELLGAHPQLVPLVAHDRATFGGMLISCGAATLLPALWGFRRGQAWLWWALMLGGNVAYLSTVLVHWTVGYHSLKHLVPAYGGLALLWIGGIASYAYLAGPDQRLQAAWQQRLESE